VTPPRETTRRWNTTRENAIAGKSRGPQKLRSALRLLLGLDSCSASFSHGCRHGPSRCSGTAATRLAFRGVFPLEAQPTDWALGYENL